MVSIRLARPQELDEIWLMVRRVVAHMKAQGSVQWGEDYPTRDFYEEDITRGELLCAITEDGRLAGVACYNTDETPEYDEVAWTTSQPAMVIHRMAVDPELQSQGVGRAFFVYVEEEARRRGLPALRIDTYSQNERMQRLIASRGYQKVGEVHIHDRPLPFPCFEKALC